LRQLEKGGFEKNLLLLNPLEEIFLPELLPADSIEPGRIVFKPENAAIIEKHGVKMRIYTTKIESINAAVLYQET
jgi:hypothetical protein